MKRFFECLIPNTICNLKCSYCYIIQENRRAMQASSFKYSVDHMIQGLTEERLNGQCYFSLCGAGETLVQDEVTDLVKGLLENGHFVNVTTNGTLSKKFDLLIEKCKPYISHLHISFSFHYLELQRLNLLETFFANVKKMRESGASVLVQMNLCDEYIEKLDEIKAICIDKIGAYPQLALTRDESSVPMKIMTKYSDEEYYSYGKKFNSPLFDFTYKNFNQKRKEFCYAGDWSGLINFETGVLTKCYSNPEGSQDIFEDISKPINFEAVGKNCHNCYCINSSHFLSLGVIPSLKNIPSYADLRNRKEACWYSDEMLDFLNAKLYKSNKKYGIIKKIFYYNSFFRKVRIKLNLIFNKK